MHPARILPQIHDKSNPRSNKNPTGQPCKPNSARNEKKMWKAPVDYKNINFSLQLIKVSKVPRELPDRSARFHPKGRIDLCQRTRQYHRASLRARRFPTCTRMTGQLRVTRSRVCKRGWSGAQSRCCVGGAKVRRVSREMIWKIQTWIQRR